MNIESVDSLPAVASSLRPRNSTNLDINDVVNSLKAVQIYDYLRIARNKDLIKFLALEKKPCSESRDDDGPPPVSSSPRAVHSPNTSNVPYRPEKLQFSDSVIKINKRDKAQGRHLIITDQAVYNFHPKKYSKCRRRIAHSKIKSMVLSHASDELVLQIYNEHDYRFVIQRRAEVVEVISKFYELETGSKLPIVMTADKDLKGFVHTKDEMLNLHKTKSLSVHSAESIGAPEIPASPVAKAAISHVRSVSTNIPTVESSTFLHSMKNDPNIVPGFRAKNTILEGWLTKKKGRSSTWDRKYFILTSDKISYLTPRIKGNFPIGECKFVKEDIKVDDDARPDSVDGTTQKTAAFKDFAFSVKARDRREPIYIAAASREDFERWQAAFTTQVAPADQEFVHLEGWLMKKDPTSKNWRARYFVIVNDRCWYFEMILKGTIDLTNGVSGHDTKHVENTESTHTNFAGLTSRTRFAYRFNITDGSRQYEVGADSKEDMDLWIHTIEKAGRKHTRGMSISKKKHPTELSEQLKEALTQEAPTGQVTFVFTDVQSSTTLWEMVPDAMDLSLSLHDENLRKLLKKYRGYEVKTEGDAFMVTFFSALDAILWCMEVQLTLVEQNWPAELLALSGACKEDVDGKVIFNGIRIRMGIHTGQPNARRNPITGRMDYFGPVVNCSARVSDAGHGGQIMITQEIFDVLYGDDSKKDERLVEFAPQVKDCGVHQLKGIKHDVQIFELLPKKLDERSARFPPIRTITNEKKAAKEKKAALAASASMTLASENSVASSEEPVLVEGEELLIPAGHDDFSEDEDLEVGEVEHELDVISENIDDDDDRAPVSPS